jgi:hypothetical protein
MFCDHSQLRRRHKTAGQDVFLEYRRHAKSSCQALPDPPLVIVKSDSLTVFLPRLRLAQRLSYAQ